MRMLAATVFVLTLTLTGCGRDRPAHTTAPAAPPRGSSGIQGTITVDIGCPHLTSTPCPRRPLRAQLLIRPAEAPHPAIHADSEADGSFRVPLPPGTYTIQPQNMTGAPVPTAFPLTVTVHPGTWTTFPVEFDSGIR
jgi:hypothetical protein